ncbi:hypothetical protein BOTBODRAFT_55844 [Botryobasidium botryosum FD-172 SS1]|uniref:Uncharacterized protein n=1 Tax=Botryobasidium botryosum (strain FD-172 SS1) TaxID=930990 RepID=A0A067MPR1_BOTB1|nr:hypothetical protein BOTBODRAFT_55844 [Botryobasidium botryosum FD-172 SS1]
MRDPPRPHVSRIGSPTQSSFRDYEEHDPYAHPGDTIQPVAPPPRVTFSVDRPPPFGGGGEGHRPATRYEGPPAEDSGRVYEDVHGRPPHHMTDVPEEGPYDDGWRDDQRQSFASQVRRARDDEPFVPTIHSGGGSVSSGGQRPLPTAPYPRPRPGAHDEDDYSDESERPPSRVSRPGATDVLRDAARRAEAGEAERMRIFDENERRRNAAAAAADDAERERQAIFDANEAERQRAFEEAEAERHRLAELRRQDLARVAEERRNDIAQAAEREREEHEHQLLGAIRENLAATEHSARTVSELIASDRQSVMSALSLMDIARADQRAAHEERERAVSIREADCQRQLEEHRERVRMLEEELARAREGYERERAAREALEQEHFERQRNEANARHGELRTELGDIANLLSNQSYENVRRQELEDERLQAKEARRAEKAEQLQSLHDIVNHLLTEREDEKRRQEAERAAAAARPSIESVLEALRRQNAEQAALMTALAEGGRAEKAKCQAEILEAVRATALEQVPFNVQKYLDEFSRALSAEVRMLLKEVGRLREEKRALLHEIGFLLSTKGKYGTGGEFDPDQWKPIVVTPPRMREPAPSLAEEPELAKPAWRPSEMPKKPRRMQPTPAPATAPTPMPMPMPMSMPMPTAAPQPPVAPVSAPMAEHPTSWVSWKPNPLLAPTPVPTERAPNVSVQERAPGLFGPRSPRDSWN